MESLSVEYSETNVKLTRCSTCHKVADKYIEYELFLVIVDVILHRKAAIRHLLFNRWDSNQVKVQHATKQLLYMTCSNCVAYFKRYYFLSCKEVVQLHRVGFRGHWSHSKIHDFAKYGIF